MHYPEDGGPASGGLDSGGPVALVVIGHAGLATDQTASGTATALGGSGYAVAATASAILAGVAQVGLVAQVGTDLDWTPTLQGKGLSLAGLAVLPGMSARFVIHQFRDGTRSFGSELGVAATPRLDLFPDAYLHAEHVHLGSAPPEQQLTWLRFLRDRGSAARISVDMFEYFVETEPHASREACELADLLFMNETEYEGLYSADIYPKSPVVLKHGAAGAELIRDGMRHHVRAPVVHEVDPIGAGEVLAGALLALHARGLSEEQALRYAVAAATSSITEFGVDGPLLAAELIRIGTEVSRSGRSAAFPASPSR
jgi:sugar/nucleoside kinase (ribokinase family)